MAAAKGDKLKGFERVAAVSVCVWGCGCACVCVCVCEFVCVLGGA